MNGKTISTSFLQLLYMYNDSQNFSVRFAVVCSDKIDDLLFCSKNDEVA